MTISPLSLLSFSVGLGASLYLVARIARAIGRKEGSAAEASAWRKREITTALGADVELKLTDWCFVDDGMTIVTINPDGERFTTRRNEAKEIDNSTWTRIDKISSHSPYHPHVSSRYGAFIYAQLLAWLTQRTHNTKQKDTK